MNDTAQSILCGALIAAALYVSLVVGTGHLY